MRLEMLVETQVEILDGQSSYIFSNEPFEKTAEILFSVLKIHVESNVENGWSCTTVEKVN